MKVIVMAKYFLSFLLLVSVNIYGQVDEVAFYADAMVNANDKQHRSYAQEKFAQLLTEKIAKNPQNLNFIDELKGISVLRLEEFKSRMITWQNKNEDNSFNHYGMVVNDLGEMTHLKDHSKKLGESEYELLNPAEWYGAYYYDFTFDTKGNHYLLFGFNGVNGTQYEKIVDVLYKNSENKWVFGKEMFLIKEDEIRPDIKSRITVQYSPLSVVAFKYDMDTDMLIHDYTVETTNDFDGNFIGKVPDGTYVGYERKGLLWKRIDKLENTFVEEIKPDYNTKRDTSKPDILGRKRNGN
jgi:hypothetical protein